MNYRKLSSIIYALLIVLSIVAPITFLGNVARATITGRPVVQFFNGTDLVEPVNVPAILEDGQALIINFSTVDFTASGAMIWIWFAREENGGAEITLEDAPFIGPIYVSDLSNPSQVPREVTVYPPFNKMYNDVNPNKEGVQTIVYVGEQVVNITKLPGMFEHGEGYWIKITDVSPERGPTIPSSDISVSSNLITFKTSFYAYSVVGTDYIVVPNEPLVIGAYAASPGTLYNITLDGELIEQINASEIVETAQISDYTYIWKWSGFEYTDLNAPDLELAYIEGNDTFIVKVTQADNSTISKEFTFTELPRKVIGLYKDGTLISTTPIPNGTTTVIATLETGEEYNISLCNFPYQGKITITLNGTIILAENVELNDTGCIEDLTFKVPYVPHSGKYNFTITDNNGKVYWFIVNVSIVPFIEVVPDEGYVGDTTLVYGYYFSDYVDDRINIWFQINNTHYALVANFTVPDINWVVEIEIPHATCGDHLVIVTEDNPATPKVTDSISGQIDNVEDTFTVHPKLEIVPTEFPADGRIVKVYGTGFCTDDVYSVIIDTHYMTNVIANGTGDLYIEFVAAGFQPGNHSLALYPMDPIYYSNVTVASRVPAFAVLFKVTGTTLDDVMAKLDEIEAMLSDMSGTLLVIKDNVAYLVSETQSISLSISDLKVMITQLGDSIELKLDDINSSLAKLIIKKGDEVVGTLTTKLSDLDAKITDVSNNVVTISTVLGDVKTTVSDLKNGQAEIKDLIKTKSGDIVAVIDTAKGNILAELSTVEDLIKNGVKVDTENILAKIDELKSSVGTVSDKLDALAASLDNVKSSLDDIKSSVSAVKSSVEDVKSSVSSAISSAVDDLKTSIEDKANSVSGSVSTYGLVNLILILVAIILTAYVGFFHKKE